MGVKPRQGLPQRRLSPCLWGLLLAATDRYAEHHTLCAITIAGISGPPIEHLRGVDSAVSHPRREVFRDGFPFRMIGRISTS